MFGKFLQLQFDFLNGGRVKQDRTKRVNDDFEVEIRVKPEFGEGAGRRFDDVLAQDVAQQILDSDAQQEVLAKAPLPIYIG